MRLILLGGSALYIETVGTKNPDKEAKGTGGFRITGTLGDVMKESASLALVNAKRYLEALMPGNAYFYNHDINLHVPEGATPKVILSQLNFLPFNFSGWPVCWSHDDHRPALSCNWQTYSPGNGNDWRDFFNRKGPGRR